MAFWLATSRQGQDYSAIQRFDPRFWTVNFPRPMMASIITTAADALRIDCEFHHRGALAGLIWESEDRFDHPLLAYDTERDYSHCILSFRWRSSGIIPLHAAHGPTLTIEGRDAGGAARTWYVRLWNYASGTTEDAEIVLPFSKLASGWALPGTPIDPHRIDRMFISVTPPGFVPGSDELLPQRADGWVEMSEIRCEGERAMLNIGDILMPAHGEQIATAYDDSFNQSPARLLRNIRGLGYRGRVLHYVGMSHFFRLAPSGDGALLVDNNGTLCEPARIWHASFFALCAELGLRPVASLSYELFAAHCPSAWQQVAADGTPARTGWEPPSALLGPACDPAMAWLRSVAVRFTDMMEDAGLPVLFQIGEPWWWVTESGAICLYDDAARAAFGGDPPAIDDMRLPLSDAQKALLDQAGALLSASTSALASAVRTAASGPCEIYLLTFTPTILNPETPELRRANLPSGWAYPAFDRLQVEDYDWLTAGADYRRRLAYEYVDQNLGYPKDKQDYLAGFVLRSEDAEPFWQHIDEGLNDASEHGIAERFVWALPQIVRDGYCRLPAQFSLNQGQPAEDDMQAFDDVLYPLALGRDTAVSPEFSTSVAVTASGHERRSTLWADARLRYDVGPGVRSEQELGTLIAFFRARRGAARGFRLRDPYDFSSREMVKTPSAFDQLLGIGDGNQTRFALVKHYGSGDEPQTRRITRPAKNSIRVSVDDVETDGWDYAEGGFIEFSEPPSPGAHVRAGFTFDVPVRFAEDRLDIAGAAFAAGEAPSVPLIELREQL